MAAAKSLIALLILLSPVAAAAAPAALGVSEDLPTAKASPETERAAAVDAPPVLPLFAGALAVLGWRLGRRRRR